MADALTEDLRGLGLEVDEDAAGNLLARVPGPEGAPTVLLCAHMDTVPLDGPVKVVSDNGLLTNRHEAILGADNKAAVATIMGAVRADRARRQGRGRGRDPVHDRRGAGARGRQGLRQLAPERRLRLRLRPRLADRRDRARLADLLLARGALQGQGRPRRDPPRGGPQRDRRGGARDRRHADRPDRRRDDRERGPHRGRHGRERGGRALLRRARDAQPRRRRARARW